MAKYIRDRLGFKVHIMAIKGFSVDARGMDNTINFFKKMQPNYVISCIDNCKFLTEAGNNFKKAEELANKEIANRLWVLRGLGIVPSDQNIDEKELRKIATREGFNNIEYFEIPDDVKIKNNQIFNKLIKDIIDESKSMEISTPSQKCMGIIINLPENEAQYIDLKFPEIKSAYGNPFEIYPHIQWSDAMPKFISFICTGMKLPIDEIKNIIENFKKEFEMVDTSKDTFFDDLKSIQTVPSNLFDLDEAKPTKTSDDDFFNNLFGSDGDDILNNF